MDDLRARRSKRARHNLLPAAARSSQQPNYALHARRLTRSICRRSQQTNCDVCSWDVDRWKAVAGGAQRSTTVDSQQWLRPIHADRGLA